MGNLEITQIESNWDFSFLKVNVMFPYSPVVTFGKSVKKWRAYWRSSLLY